MIQNTKYKSLVASPDKRQVSCLFKNVGDDFVEIIVTLKVGRPTRDDWRIILDPNGRFLESFQSPVVIGITRRAIHFYSTILVI